MADLHKLTVQESMNAAGHGGVWTVQSIATHSSAAEGHTVHVDASAGGQVGVLAAGDIYFNFAATALDVETDNDLYLPGNVLTFITVPRGLGSTIYFNHLGKGAACAVRVVLV